MASIKGIVEKGDLLLWLDFSSGFLPRIAKGTVRDSASRGIFTMHVVTNEVTGSYLFYEKEYNKPIPEATWYEADYTTRGDFRNKNGMISSSTNGDLIHLKVGFTSDDVAQAILALLKPIFDGYETWQKHTKGTLAAVFAERDVTARGAHL